MSITTTYERLSVAELARLQSDPAAADAFFRYELEDEDELIDFFERKAALGNRLDIDQAWAALHFLLTGLDPLGPETAAPPLGDAIQGGAETKWEATYGMVRVLMPDVVREIAAVLEKIDQEVLAARFDPTKLNAANIYPGPRWSEDDLPPLLDTYARLRDFYRETAARGDALLIASS